MSSFTITRKTSAIGLPVLGAIILNFGLALIYLVIWIVAYNRDMFWRADFTAFYTGATIVWSGNGDRLFDPDLQAAIQSQILSGYVEPGSLAMRYVNPPHLALIIAPLAAFPRTTAYIVWTLIQLILLAWMLRLIWKITCEWKKQEQWVAVSAALGLHFLMLNFMLGAFSLFMLCCLLEFYLSAKLKNDTLSGAWLAVSALKPQNIVLEGVLLLGSRRWKALLSAVGVSIFFIAASTILLGPRIWVDYLDLLVSHSTLFDEVSVNPRSMYNLKGALTLLFGQANSTTINLISYIALAIAALCTGWLWFGPACRQPNRFELYFALTVLLGLIFSPHLNPQDGLLIILPALLFADYLKRNNRRITSFTAFTVLSPLLFLIFEFSIGSELGFRLPFIFMLIFVVWISREIFSKEYPASTPSLNIPKQNGEESSSPKIILKILVLITGIILVLVGLYMVFVRLEYIDISSSDFLQDHVAASHLLSGESIYIDEQFRNNHPPFDALLAVPFTFFDYETAVTIWTLITIFLYVLMGYLVFREFQIHLPLEWLILAVGFWICWYPFLSHLALGQLSILVGFLIILGWHFLRNGKEVAGGIVIALAVLIKLYPALFILYLAGRKKWKALIVMLLTMASGFLLTSVFTGVDDILHYFQVVAPRDAAEFAVFPVNFSISGVYSRLFIDGPWVKPLLDLPILANILKYITSLILVLLLGYLAWTLPKDKNGDDAVFSITLIAMLLLTPIVWQHSLPMLVLPFLFIYVMLRKDNHPASRQLSMIALMLFSLPDLDIARSLMSIVQPNQMPWYAGLLLLTSTGGLGILWTVIYRMSRR